MIKTHEELLKLHGRKVTCKIYGAVIDDAKISVDGNKVYLCQGDSQGQVANDKLGYQYSWLISCENKKYEDDNWGGTEIELVDDATFVTEWTHDGDVPCKEPRVKEDADKQWFKFLMALEGLETYARTLPSAKLTAYTKQLKKLNKGDV